MEKLILPKFNGEDFAVWQFQIESYLAVHDLLEVVDGTIKCRMQAVDLSGLNSTRRLDYSSEVLSKRMLYVKS